VAKASNRVAWISSNDFSRERPQAKMVFKPGSAAQKRGMIMVPSDEKS